MSLVLLPTADIVREHQRFESLLCFYDEGVRGVVRDAVVLNAGAALPLQSLQELVALDVMEHYGYAYHLRYLENTLPHYLTPDTLVELAAYEITDAVFRMMRELLGRLRYEVSWDSHTWRWVGDDLAVLIKVLNHDTGNTDHRLRSRASTAAQCRLQ